MFAYLSHMPKDQPHSVLIKDSKNVFWLSLICSLKVAIPTICFVFGDLSIYAQTSDKSVPVANTVEGEISRRQTQILERSQDDIYWDWNPLLASQRAT